MQKLVSLYQDLELLMKMTGAQSDEEFAELGFVYLKGITECEGFEEGPYTGFVVYKPLEDGTNGVYIATLSDNGNGYSSLLWVDTPIKEILETNDLVAL